MKRDLEFDAPTFIDFLRTELPADQKRFASGLLDHELIVDNFAGGGGTSQGLEEALGRPVDVAINHDPEALAMHALNHPYTLHLCEDVWDVNPIVVTGNRPVGLVWLSPDCKHFSKAKGGTPVEKKIRGLAWVTLRWVAKTKPRVVMLENVEEFQEWGPLIVEDGLARPDPARKGVTFRSFERQLRAHGYDVQFAEMRACDNGAPTIRKRLFMVARRDGLPIVNPPPPTHGKPDSKEVRRGKLKPWRTAAECIDFGEPAQSIFTRKRPLATNTLRRVAKGAWRHVLTNPQPFIVGVGGRMGQSPERSVDQPLQTITAKADSCIAQPVLAPLIVGAGGPAYSGKPTPVDQPFGTLTTENHRAAAVAHLAPFVADQSRPMNATTAPADEPMRTICAQVKGGHFTLIAPTMVPLRGTSPSHTGNAHDIDEPLTTISAGGTHHGLAAVHLTKFRAESNGADEGAGRAAEDPMSTITASGSNQQLVMAYFVKYYGNERDGIAISEPMHTIPTKDRFGLVEMVQVPLHPDAIPELQRTHAKHCADLLHEYLPEQFPEPADMVIMQRGDQIYVLVDITLRMLKPPELYRAQGFPRTYIHHEIPNPKLLFVDGRQVKQDPRTIPRIPLTLTAQVRMCGNSVSPAQSKALALWNFAHEPLVKERLTA